MAASNAQKSQDEQVLVERVFLRFGSADTDEQLQTCLSKFLTPVLLKLNSPDEKVRTKVLELLVHVNKRLKSRQVVQLPVESLMTQFMDPTATPFVTNFTIMYIKMGYPRLEPEKQAELLPNLLGCLQGRPTAQQDSLLQLLTPALQHLKLPSGTDQRRALFGLGERPEIAKLLLDYFMDVLLLPYSAAVPKATASGSDSRENMETGVDAGGLEPAVTVRPQRAAPLEPPPPGLSPQAVQRVLGGNPMGPESLEKCKLGVLKFLGADIFTELEVACHYIIGSSDTRHSVATSADLELKRIMGCIDWNNLDIVKKIYSIFQGTVQGKGLPAVKEELRRAPACTRVRLKLFPFLLRSREAASLFPANIQVVFDCLFGKVLHAKLRSFAINMVHHMCYNCDQAKFALFDAVLLNGMVRVINEAKEDPKLRSLAYVAVGKIARRSPEKATKDFSLLQQFFEAICQEDSETKLAVQEALSMMTEAFKNCDKENLNLLEGLIMQQIEKDEPQARQVATQYAAAVFPSDHIPSRYILLLATGDVKEDVRVEATKALYRAAVEEKAEEKAQTTTAKLPDFSTMINFIKNKADLRKKSAHKYVSGIHTLAFNPQTYSQVVLYLRLCLANAAGLAPSVESVVVMQDQAPAVAKYVRELLSASKTAGPISSYIAMLREFLSVTTEVKVMYCLVEIVAVARTTLAPQFIHLADWLKALVRSSVEELREMASLLFAILVTSAGQPGQAQEALKEFKDNLNHKSVDVQLGSVLGLGNLIAQQARHHSTSDTDMQTDAQKPLDAALVESCVTALAQTLKDGNQALRAAVCTALGEIGCNMALPLPPGGKDDKEGELTKWSLITSLSAMLKTSNETNKTKEKAAVCLGYLCVGDADFHRRKVMEELFNSVQGKQADLQFTIGDALVCATLGPKSSSARDAWTQTEKDFACSVGELPDEVAWYLDQLLSKYSSHSNPHVRQACCIWLLSLAKTCSRHNELQGRVQEVQMAFMRLLSETDELTQDIASKGLGLVYENCTPEQKDMLVSQLVSTLTTGKGTKQTVSGDTQVFEEGALGKAPDGAGLSTYKELCAIANDLNQPDLIYKFMNLANHNAMWNSRKGAAFGFGMIAAQAGEQLEPYLAQIVPRLYRYTFDPNPKIQTAMSSIWSAVVKDNKKTLDTYVEEILADLMKNLTSNQWRVRESSCLAVSDLLRGRTDDAVIEALPTLWETCLRVRDDIKESVRNAADSSCKTLSRLSVKVCDVGHGKMGERATEAVLPCLLKNSLHSSVPEVRAIGLSTILQISKQAGALLKPHIPVLVTALLEAISGLEPQVMNYLSLHTSSQATQEKLDSARIAASRMSPMMETVNRCVQYVDEGVLTELVPHLTQLIRSGIGVGTKVGCSSFVVSLVHQCPQELGPHAGKLMAACLHCLADRNASVRKSYATALGKLIKIAKDNSIEKLILKLKAWYLEKEGESAHHGCAQALRAMSQHGSDALNKHAALVMPLAFFAMHEKKTEEEGENAASTWEEVWNEIAPGMEAGIKLYLAEIVQLLQGLSDSQSWTMKAQAAAAMSTVASKLGASLGPPHLGSLLSTLLSGLQGRTWDGKESLLHAIEKACTSCKEALLQKKDGQPSIDEVVEALVKECRKEKMAYKVEALKCVGAVVELYEIDRFKELWEILLPMGQKEEPSAESTLECVYQTVGQAWPHSQGSQEEFLDLVLEHLCKAIPLNTWRVQVAILKALAKFINRLYLFKSENISKNPAAAEAVVKKIIPSVLPSLGDPKYAALRSESMTVIDFLLTTLLRGQAAGAVVCRPQGKASACPDLARNWEILGASGPRYKTPQAAGVILCLDVQNGSSGLYSNVLPGYNEYV